jgi:glycosyltransferase involved in cell wall biosynthesis
MTTGIVNLLTYDGVSSCYCGVGTVSRYFIKAMPDVIQKAKTRNISIKFNILTPFTTAKCLGYKPGFLDEAKSICQASSGRVLFYCNASDGQYQFGNMENWRASSVGAATLILDQEARRNHDFNITYAFDTPYCHTAQLVLDQLTYFEGKLPYIVWVPHSTGLAHETAGMPHDQSRYEWEKNAVDYASRHPNAFLGYIGKFMRNHLLNAFSASEEKLIPLINGIINPINNHPPNPVSVLSKHGIDPEKRIIFATGRAEKYKGLDALINGFAITQHLHDVDLVLLVSTHTSYTVPFDDLLCQFKTLGIRGKIIEGFIDQKEIMAIIRSPNTIAAVVPSRGEPFGLLPVEFRAWACDLGPILIVSDVGGLTEQIKTGIDGYLVNIDNSVALGELIVKVTNVDETTRLNFTREGKKRVFEDYNYPANIFQSLEMLLTREGLI